MKEYTLKINSELEIGQDVYSLSFGVCGADYICYPSENKIMKGVVTGFRLKNTKSFCEILEYDFEFNGNSISCFPYNIGTFFFKTKEDFYKYFSKLREEELRTNSIMSSIIKQQYVKERTEE